MAIDPIVAPLLCVELFQGLKPLQITEIARTADRIVFREGDTITEAGAAGEAAYLIVAGSCEWVHSAGAGEPIEIGSMIGEMAMFVEHSYGATVIARGSVRCLKISRETMHGLMLDDRSLAEHLTRKIAQRLHRIGLELRSLDTGQDGYAADEDTIEGAFETVVPAGEALPSQLQLN